jgi:soluble lytic murein transglycosylase-like protein
MLKTFATCLLLSAQMYGVPPAVLKAIHRVEGGQVGQAVGPNVNGTYDLGPMQINTRWLPDLASHWGVSQETALRWVRDDACTNAGVGAWILRQSLEEANNDMATAIGYYHSHTPVHSQAYQQKVFRIMGPEALTIADSGW